MDQAALSVSDVRAYLAGFSLALLIVAFIGKLAASWYAASATSRLGHTAAQRGIAYGVMLPAISYALFTFAVFPIPEIPMGNREAAFIIGMLLLAIASGALYIGWRRYDAALAVVFERGGERRPNRRRADPDTTRDTDGVRRGQ